MAFWLIACPLLAAAVAFALPSNRWRPLVVPAGAGLHLLLTVRALQLPSISAWDRWLLLDPLGELFLG